MRALDVTNVRDRRAAKLRRPGHSPARHDEFALAVRRDPDNRRHLIRKDRREGRKVPEAVVAQAKEVADRRLDLREAVDGVIAVAAKSLSLWPWLARRVLDRRVRCDTMLAWMFL